MNLCMYLRNRITTVLEACFYKANGITDERRLIKVLVILVTIQSRPNGKWIPCRPIYRSHVIWNCSELNSLPLKSVISDRTMLLAAINCRLCLMYSGRCINFEIFGSCIFDLINLVWVAFLTAARA